MWKEENNKLTQSFKFKNFIEAFGFISKVALIAESLNHHPNWSNSYNKVDIELTTHSEGDKITEQDRRLAGEIDKLMVK
ncbi:MAG: 4a-hydroxytetrahydrobiopterin dehydratase [Bacteroidetes bacterium]|nr:4a-hydroxytetrahydrobiopterin dehydratase [Bacteroidota bacterium]HET6245423.1 4a-hydroxytetrahydrobiopterin dehydratase [Bacteroidia bacterium]